MANTITGRVYKIGPTEQLPSKDGAKSFLKREIILDATKFDPWTGERNGFENYPSLEFTGDKCAELDSFQKGDIVTITFDVVGIKYRKEKEEAFFTKLRPYRIEAVKKVERAPQQPSYNPQTPPYYPPRSEMPF